MIPVEKCVLYLVAACAALFGWLAGLPGSDSRSDAGRAAPAVRSKFAGASPAARRILTEADEAVRAADPADRAALLNDYADRLAAETDDRDQLMRTRFGVLNLAAESGGAAAAADAFRKLEAMNPPPTLVAEAVVAHARALQLAGDAAGAVEVVKKLPRAGVRGLADYGAVVRSAYRSDIYAAAGDLDAARLSYLSEAPAKNDAATSEDYVDHGLSLAVARREPDFRLRVMLKAPAGVQPRHLSIVRMDALAEGEADLADAMTDLLHDRFREAARTAELTYDAAQFARSGNRPERAAELYERVLANPNAPPEVAKQAAAGLLRVRPPAGEMQLVPRPDPIGDIERDPAKIGDDDL